MLLCRIFFFWLWSSIGALWLSYSCFVAKSITSPCFYSRAYKFISYASEACVSPLFVEFHVFKFVSFTEEHLAFIFSSGKAIFGASLVLLTLLSVSDDISHSLSAIWWPLPNDCADPEKENGLNFFCKLTNEEDEPSNWYFSSHFHSVRSCIH